MADLTPIQSGPSELPGTASAPAPPRHQSAYWLWLTGASGFLGSYLLQAAVRAGWPVAYIPGQHPIPPGLPACTALPTTLNDLGSMMAAAREYPPSVIVHAAALATVGGCRQEPARAWASNVESTRHLAAVARQCGCRMLLISTDMVFSGKRAPYREDDAPEPVSLYGATKAAAEEVFRASQAPGAVVRCPLMYGMPLAEWHTTQLGWLLGALGPGGTPPTLFRDEYRTPGDVRYVAQAALALASASDLRGTYHLGGPERLSRIDFGRLVAEAFHLDPSLLREGSLLDASGADPRPPDLSLISDRARREVRYDHPSVLSTLREWALAASAQV